MSEPLPVIYSPRVEAIRMSLAARALALAVSLACLSVMIVAAELKPSPTGIGTHTEMGLQSCAFEQRTGLPCPTCGMTTSFAWFARGNVVASFYVQPMGTVLAILTVAIFWTAIYIAVTGRAAHRLMLFIPGRVVLISLLSWGVIAWVWKIFIHKHGIDGWH